MLFLNSELTPMRYILFAFFLLVTIQLFGQSASDADIVRQTLRDASFSRQIVVKRTVFFSSRDKQDSVILIVPAGLIRQTHSSLLIKTVDKRIIFNEQVKTNYFIRGIFEPDSIPPGGQDIYETYITKYITSLTKDQFENYAKNTISNFLNDITISKSQLKQAISNGTIVDKELYKNIREYSNVGVIWFPCFQCDEGTRYFAYSSKKASAVKFLETD
jgi:hypothetical protein